MVPQMITASRIALACLLAFATVSAAVEPPTSSATSYGRINGGALSVVAQVQAKPGKEAALRAATLPLIDLVRGDPKNLLYFLQEDRAAPGHFIFYEIFASESDFEAHNNMPYVQAWFAKLPELADGGVQVMKMEVLSKPVPSSLLSGGR